MRWSWPRLAELAIPGLALLADGAWLAVAYVAVQTAVAGAPPLLSTLELAAVAGLAAWLSATGRLRPDDRPLAFFGWCVGLGIIGWLWSADARAALLAGDWVTALGEHPGGWLALAAFMRGVGRADPDDRALTRFVLLGVPALALPWLLGQLAPAALRGAFVDAAFVSSLTFMAAGFSAAGLARLAAIGRETGIDWRRDRAWLVLLAGVLVVIVGVGVPSAALLGLPLDAVFRGVLGPLLTLIGYALLVIVVPIALASYALASVLRAVGLELPPPVPPSPDDLRLAFDTYTFEELQGGLLGVAVFLALTLLLAVIVLRVWVGRRRAAGQARPLEERAIVLPQTLVRLPHRRDAPRPRRALAATDAETAYLAALDLLAAWPDLARRAAETPLAHARRLLNGVVAPDARAAPAGADGALGRLAIAFALSRYGGRRLPEREHRRALARLGRLRSRLPRRGGP
jgi:hypothetical protein